MHIAMHSNTERLEYVMSIVVEIGWEGNSRSIRTS